MVDSRHRRPREAARPILCARSDRHCQTPLIYSIHASLLPEASQGLSAEEGASRAAQPRWHRCAHAEVQGEVVLGRRRRVWALAGTRDDSPGFVINGRASHHVVDEP